MLAMEASRLPAPMRDPAGDDARDIAVVVLTHSRVHLLRKCVENVLGRTSPATREIVIWNNASTDGTREYLDSLDDPRLMVVHHDSNIGVNAYRRAAALTSAAYIVEVDDDVVSAPPNWDATLLDAFQRLPGMGYLAADIEDDPHDPAAHHRYHVYEYDSTVENGLPLLLGPTGGACAMTSREVYDHVGGFKERDEIFYLEDWAYIRDVEKAGYRVAVLADLRVLHNGGPYYADQPKEKEEYWRRRNREIARKEAIKRVLFRLPFFRRLNARFDWCIPPS
jgi:GT2 family glycosyltransferase